MIRWLVKHRTRLAIAAVLLGAVAIFVTSARPVFAAGETYVWASNNAITVTGGSLTRPATLVQQDERLFGDQTARFAGTLYANDGRGECVFSMALYTYKAGGNGSGRLETRGGPGAGTGGRTCDDAFVLSFNGATVSIGGTRPGDPNNTTETPEQRVIQVVVQAPDPLSTAPKTDTITIKRLDGSVVSSQTIPLKDDSGTANWPPDQTPVAGTALFQNIDAGEYLVCDTYVAKECVRVKKEKGKFLGVTIGKRFQTPNQKRIRVNVIYHSKRPCGSTLSISPVLVELTGPDGKIQSVQTQPAQSTPGPEEKGALCTAQVEVGLKGAVFENMAPGQYQACATGAECVGGNKKDGEELELTLHIITEQDAPPDQPICMTGDGIAGALAWIACPVVEIIAKATDIFERNIIIPFMTVSPLTTSDKNPIYILWQNLRDIANVAFVVLVLYSILSISLSKYNLKRLLPRLLIVAIGINLSYFVVAIIVDLFNVLGAGISQFIMSALQQSGTTMPTNATKSSPVQSLFVIGGAALLSVIVTAGNAIGWLFGAIGIAFLFILITILVLIIRQFAIILLVVLSPIAILMYLLPNTEGLFTKWRRMLVQLLMMFPLMVLLFAAGKILGVLIMQPDFKIGAIQGFAALMDLPYQYLAQATAGVSEQFVQSVKIILWFLANALAPGIGLPLLMASSGAIMDKSFGFANQKLLKNRIKRSRDELSTLGGEARTNLARSRYLPGLNRLAGAGLTKKATLNARQSNLQHEQEEYVAARMGKSSLMQHAAAGVAGKSGRTRAAAGAAGVAAKATKEDIDNEMALLEDKMHEIGIDEESMSDKIADYIENPTAGNAVVTGATGKSFNLATEGKGMQRAMLNSAASQGHVSAIEAARMNPNIDQSLVDSIIRRNEGKLKSQGGHHLTTQFNLAAGRDFDLNTPQGRNDARVQMHAQRLTSMANSGQNSIVEMKYGMLTGTADMLEPTRFSTTSTSTPAAQMQHRNDVLAAMNPADRALLRDKLNAILAPSNASTLAKADVDPEVFQHIRDNM